MIIAAFKPAWELFVSMSTDVERYRLPEDKADCWPMLGLAKRAAQSARSIVSLAQQGLWLDAQILLRAMFEIQVNAEVIAEAGRSRGIKEYLREMAVAKQRLIAKIGAGQSLFSQVLAHAPGVSGRLRENVSDSDASAGQATFRGRAGGVDGERTYDSFYWLASQFVHATPLSVVGSSTSALDKEPPPIKELFA